MTQKKFQPGLKVFNFSYFYCNDNGVSSFSKINISTFEENVEFGSGSSSSALSGIDSTQVLFETSTVQQGKATLNATATEKLSDEGATKNTEKNVTTLVTPTVDVTSTERSFHNVTLADIDIFPNSTNQNETFINITENPTIENSTPDSDVISTKNPETEFSRNDLVQTTAAPLLTLPSKIETTGVPTSTHNTPIDYGSTLSEFLITPEPTSSDISAKLVNLTNFKDLTVTQKVENSTIPTGTSETMTKKLLSTKSSNSNFETTTVSNDLVVTNFENVTFSDYKPQTRNFENDTKIYESYESYGVVSSGNESNILDETTIPFTENLVTTEATETTRNEILSITSTIQATTDKEQVMNFTTTGDFSNSTDHKSLTTSATTSATALEEEKIDIFSKLFGEDEINIERSDNINPKFDENTEYDDSSMSSLEFLDIGNVERGDAALIETADNKKSKDKIKVETKGKTMDKKSMKAMDMEMVAHTSTSRKVLYNFNKKLI